MVKPGKKPGNLLYLVRKLAEQVIKIQIREVAMRFLRDILVFLAGAMFFHGLSHIWLANSGLLPIHMSYFDLTSTLNLYAIIANFAIMIVLLLIVRKMKR